MCICERVCYDAPDAHTLCSHARADDTALHGMCASATLSLHEARSMGTLTHVVLIDTINARSYIPARSYMEDRITDACVRHESAHVLRSCARACGCGRARAFWCAFARPLHLRRTGRALPVVVDRVWLGAQAFRSASAFYANIGAWNTAAVTTLSHVCAAFSARAARHRGGTRSDGAVDASRAVVRGGTAGARACVRRCVGMRTRGCQRV